MPAEPVMVAIVDTDVDGDQVESFDDTLGKQLLGRDVEDVLTEALRDADISYEDDVKPLLGSPLVIGVEESGDEDAEVVAAIAVGDEDKLRETLDKLPDVERYTFVDDGMLVVSDTSEGLDAARARHDDGQGLDPDVVEATVGALPEDALLTLYADVDDGLMPMPELAPLKDAPWFDSITSFGAALSFEGQRVRAEALVATDHARPEDLPVVSGTSEQPHVVARDGWISGANVNQSQTTTFLLRAVRAAFPDSEFVRDVATVERERGIDFEREFLRQFDGPSQSLLAPDGRFAARSEVRDPERLAATLEKVAPDLGRLVEDLQALRSTGLGVLLLLAPDAPAASNVLESANVEVTALGDDLYRMSALEDPAPASIVFGLIDGVFVVAEDEQAAAEIAAAPTQPFDGPPGPAVLSASGAALQHLTADYLGIGTNGTPAREVSAALEAAPDGLRARLVADFDD
jgi:hypothetical protein